MILFVIEFVMDWGFQLHPYSQLSGLHKSQYLSNSILTGLIIQVADWTVTVELGQQGKSNYQEDQGFQ